MAERHDSPSVYLVDPEVRCIFPFERFHVPRRLARTLRSGRFTFTINQSFGDVIAACAAPQPGREETWISPGLMALYVDLHARGYAHSVETRCEGRLIGGLYGVALGGAFFGESMFSLETDASKAALVDLVARLKRGGFRLLDAQFHTAHLAQFGCETVPRTAFRRLLEEALSLDADFCTARPAEGGDQGLQSIAQIS